MSDRDLPLFQKSQGSSTPPASDALSVSTLTLRIKRNLEGEFHDLWVQGEIGNLKEASSGHVYFSLKDENATISAAAFGWSKKKNPGFQLKDGLQVICKGNVSVYAQRGNYQLLVDTIEPMGAGALQLAFEQLKEKLMKEGLFDAGRKRPLPKYPSRIVVISSPQAAALRDILTVLRRRAPFVEVVIVPALVQGDDAPPKLIQALKVANHYRLGEVILLSRGGGSMEDLWAFNHEELARTIAASAIPVISAVGHEIDFTIADFVADLRAPTPSAGAEIITQHWVELRERTRQLESRLLQSIRREIMIKRRTLEAIAAKLRNPRDQLREKAQRLDDLSMRMERLIAHLLERKKMALERLTGQLHALSPLAVLSRGYALVQDDQGKLIRSAKQVKSKQAIGLRFADGEVKVRAE
jgi:exodeoxyribonuclease VII large subunit